MSHAGPGGIRPWLYSVNLRLKVERFPDGWGWCAWEALTHNGWDPLPPPALENLRRRFRTPEQVEQFFGLLAELLFETTPVRGLRNSACVIGSGGSPTNTGGE
jgi:hypothetical protein